MAKLFYRLTPSGISGDLYSVEVFTNGQWQELYTVKAVHTNNLTPTQKAIILNHLKELTGKDYSNTKLIKEPKHYD